MTVRPDRGSRFENSSTFHSLRSRNFRLFFGGQLLSQIGTWISQITLTLLVLHITDSGIAIGLLLACQYVPMLLFGAWTGLVADRSDKRRLLLIVQSLAMAQSFVFAAMAATGDPPLLALYGVALLGGFATAFDNPVRRAFVVEMVPEEDVQNAVSLNSAVMTGARIVGPAIAGALVATTGFAWSFLVDGLSYLFVLSGLLLMRPDELRRSPALPREKGQVRSGVRYLRNQPDLWIAMVMMAVIGSLGFNFNVILPLLVRDTFGRSDTAFTILYSVMSVGSLIAALYTARRTTMSVRTVVVAATVFGATLLMLAASPSLAIAYLGAFAVGFGSIVYMTTATAIVQLRADPTMRGRVLALQGIVLLGSAPLAGPLMGAVCELASPRVALLIAGVATLSAAAWGRLADARSLTALAQPASPGEAQAQSSPPQTAAAT